ncbi:trypsin-like peptidase domain-containing protein [Nostoc flagelliforme FACHB-838]|uniref:Trypsin-like peptidase domain-containing protein n=1 Tax=Nostoc flagelliforme FACHB-838 TaxID=2692904 RepID=A0ABR8E0T5_9NOSO|nr:trypsin-like peptidase domain-containing protein [Nostoc flagelliforme]MBD2535023.1 trypsin-like peptidase domain-containing protein [Nostoc flagelliforme FACHB-838]
MKFAGLSAILFGAAIVIIQPLVVAALTPSEASVIAQQITVRIDGANTGSGVILESQGNNYTVITCWHVVQLEGSYTVQTSDGKQYTINHSQVKRLPGVDLAVFQFTSNQNYFVAKKGNSEQVKLGTNVYVAGYPQGTSDIDFRKGSISRVVTKPNNGYAFIYDIGGFPGMSGGPILDEQGKLVGIHGRATTRPDTNATTVYGIPLKTYLSFAPSTSPVNANNLSIKFVLAKTLKEHSNYVIRSVAFSPDGKTLASGSSNKTIKIWNVATGQEITTLKDKEDSDTVMSVLQGNSVVSVAFSPDGKTLASGSLDGTIKIWNVRTGQEITTLQGHSSSVRSVAFSPDGKTLASGDWRRTIKIWNVGTGQEITKLQGHSDYVESVAFSPDGITLASGSKDGTIKIWNVRTGQEITTLKGHSSYVLSVTFSPDGKTLASGSTDKTIKIWNVTAGQEITTLQGHSRYVQSVTFSPDGKTLASGSWDGTIKIWNVRTGQEITTLQGHSSYVLSVTFSPDGKTLASGSKDETIKIWQLSK